MVININMKIVKKLITILIILFCLSGYGQRVYKIENDSIVETSNGYPKTFTRQDGTYFFGGYQNASDSIHYLDGWRVETSRPIYDSDLQYLSQPYYDVNIDSVTWDVLPKELPPIDDIKAQKLLDLRQAVRGLYDDIQWYLSMLRENDEPIPSGVKTRLTQIRTQYANKRQEILNLQTQEEVIKYPIPYEQIEAIKQQIEVLME